jgi:CHAT domain-containing protein
MPRDTVEGLEFPQLEETAIEATSIAVQFGARALIGPEASERNVRLRMPLAAVIHIASHGLAYSSEERARESFVALGPSGSGVDAIEDGFLRVGELLDDPQLTLRAELVTLSACQTGLGNLRESEGTVGLQRAFLARGARSVLVSLWKVPDPATRELMVRFYRIWLDPVHPVTKAEALRRAQTQVKALPGFAHPYFWAGFQLVGAP